MASQLPPSYLNSDKNSFAYESVHDRWLKIIKSAHDDVKQTIDETKDSADKEEIVEQGNVILNQIDKIHNDLETDKALEPFSDEDVEKYADLKDYNTELAKLAPLTWYSAPWLYSECHLYRLIALFFSNQSKWARYDPYARQKRDAFKASQDGVIELAVRYQDLAKQLAAGELSADVRKLLFREFIDISLWGNATDLSLLATVSLDNIKSLQGAESRKKNESNILTNDLDAAYTSLIAKREAADKARGEIQVDMVLDNAGFEFYADCSLILFLLDSKLADTVVVHPKVYPWFVSDVLPADVLTMLGYLNDPNFFNTTSNRRDLDFISQKLTQYHIEGKLVIRPNEFWTTSYTFDEIRSNGAGKAVWEYLKDSALVIFKGDLNHRKLVRDVEWPRTTPFTTAIGALATSGVTVLTLRTIKADVVVGLKEGAQEELEKKWVEAGNKNKLGWAYSGKWAVIQFSEGN